MKTLKLMFVAALLMGLSHSAKAADKFLSNFKAGNWTGTVADSVSADLKGKKITATTEATADQVKIVTRVEGAKGQEREEWVLTPTKLVQTEFDAAGKAVGASYTANAKSAQTDSARTFDINCADRTAGKCDNGIDFHNNWSLVASGNTFKYIVTGLRDKTKPDSLGTRHVFEFNYAGAGK